jgi:hypothetical protein
MVAMVVAGPIIPIASAATLSISTSSCPTGTQYAVYAGCTIAAAGGTAPYKFSWSTNNSYSALPEGLTLNPTTGAISGTVYGEGSYDVDFVVTDAAGASTNKEIDMEIAGDNTLGGCSLFPSDSIFHTNISALPVDTSPAAPIPAVYQSATIKPYFGDSNYGGPVGIPFIRVPWNQALSTVVTTQYQSDFTSAPIPSYVPVEGTSNGVGGDQHVLVLQTAGNGNPCKLWEMWQGSSTGPNSWTDSSNASWQNLSTYALTPLGGSNSVGGDGTTDAAGLPVMPLLVTYDEVASGLINHPIRFTLNNMEHNYVWPATTGYAGVGSCAGVTIGNELSQSAPPSSCTTSGPAGEIYRLKASVPVPTQCANDPQSLTIITAFRNYGIILADNGNSGGLIGTPDARWNDNQLSCLSNLTLSDFEPVNVSSLMVNPDSAATKASGSVTTPTPVVSDTTPPTVSITSPASGASISGTVTVSASASDNVGATSVGFYLDGTLAGTDTTSPYTFSLNTGSITNGTHVLLAKASDAAGNVGSSASVTVTISNPVTDAISPSIPTGLTVGTITASSISLSWTASTDNVGVVGYNVYRKGTKVGTSTTASYKDTGLTASTAYSYTVSAYDAAGNTSGQSKSISATTSAGTVTSTPTSTPPVSTPTSTPTSSIPMGPAGYTFCSNEYGTCSFNGTMSVAYGSGSSFHYLTLSNGTACGNAVFGDPSVGADKACFIKAVTTTTLPPTPTSTPSSTYVVPPITPTSTPTPTSTGIFQIGTRVRTTARINVRSTYGKDNDKNVRGTQATSQTGTIVGGPITLDGYVWWKVQYDSGVSGWSAQDWLVAVTAMGQSTTTVAQQPATTNQPVVAEGPSPETISQLASVLQQFQALLKAFQNAGL